MVIDEKGLMKAMKEAYKTGGYKVGCDDRSGREEMFIATARWAVTVEKTLLPPPVLGLIAEHLLGIPRPGEAFLVKKGEQQTELFETATDMLRAMHEDGAKFYPVNRTRLTMDGYSLWQRKKAHNEICVVDPMLERIMKPGSCVPMMVGEDAIMLDDLNSRVYIRAEKLTAEGRANMEFLAERMWV